ncbi:hypothetical protein [Haloarcula laminariae]|uniref:hypothetical protein n=1 Tax=Haloarcula laminariae TaxID=2961577 RepID=UPI0021C7FC76|nr:hypothetical protein [Halomicroarcula laminariae]
MDSDRSDSSVDRQSSFAERMASDFDTTLLRNLAWLCIENDGQLSRICDGRAVISEAANLRQHNQGEDIEYLAQLEEIEATLDWLARQRALELVAQACADCLTDGEAWESNTDPDEERIDAAQAEARRW